MDIYQRKEKLSKVLKIEEKRAEASNIESLMASPDFWVDREKATNLSQKLSELNQIIKKFDKASSEEEISSLEKEGLLSGEYDDKNAIVSFHAGAGGTEAQDWAQMLERMYLRYAEKRGWQTAILDESRGEEAGIKSATVEIKGHNAYGYLKGEAGVHRLVRISPFDADKARHTSFALVDIIPEMDEIGDIEIDDKDLRIDVFKSSGHGGQSVNTTDSAVRITHNPTGIVVSVQNERSQLQNKNKAMQILKSRLHQIKAKERAGETERLRGDLMPVEWGSQIRSYVLQPYQQVKDHRTGFTSVNPDKVLSGDLDGFIDSYLSMSVNP